MFSPSFLGFFSTHVRLFSTTDTVLLHRHFPFPFPFPFPLRHLLLCLFIWPPKKKENARFHRPTPHPVMFHSTHYIFSYKQILLVFPNVLFHAATCVATSFRVCGLEFPSEVRKNLSGKSCLKNASNLRKPFNIFIKTDSFRKASGFFSEKLVDGFHPYRDPSRLVSVSG